MELSSHWSDYLNLAVTVSACTSSPLRWAKKYETYTRSLFCHRPPICTWSNRLPGGFIPVLSRSMPWTGSGLGLRDWLVSSGTGFGPGVFESDRDRHQ